MKCSRCTEITNDPRDAIVEKRTINGTVDNTAFHKWLCKPCLDWCVKLYKPKGIDVASAYRVINRRGN